jgi:hypothetical protein
MALSTGRYRHLFSGLELAAGLEKVTGDGNFHRGASSAGGDPECRPFTGS